MSDTTPWFGPGYTPAQPDQPVFADRRALAQRLEERMRQQLAVDLYAFHDTELGLGFLILEQEKPPAMLWHTDIQLAQFDQDTGGEAHETIAGAQVARDVLHVAGLLVIEEVGPEDLVLLWSVMLDRNGNVVAVQPGVDGPTAEEIIGG